MLPKRKRFENPLEHYARILLKRWPTVAVVFALAMAITVVYNMSLQPRYKTSSKILIESKTARAADELSKYTYEMDYYLTQFEILKSRPIIGKVVDKLQLTSTFQSVPTQLETLEAKLIGTPLSNRRGAAREALISELQQAVKITPQTKAGLMQVTVTGSDAQQLRDICNTLVSTFIEESVQASMQAKFSTTEYLTRQLDKLNKKIQESELALEDFQKREGIQGISDKATLDTQQFSAFVEKYMQTREELWELETRIKILNEIVNREDFEGITLTNLKNDTLDQLSKELFSAEMELNKARKQDYKEKHPVIVKAGETIDFLKKQIVHEAKRYITGLGAEVAVLKKREESLGAMWQAYQDSASGNLRQRTDYAFLERDLELHRALFENYDSQLKKVQLADDVGSVTVRVIEPAMAPTAPFSPNRRSNLILGLAAGLLLGIFLAFFREYMDNTIRSIEDVSDYLEMPVLGTIPVIADMKRGGQFAYATSAPGSLVAESYRALRTNLHFFESDNALRALLVTSGGPAEGKSTTVVNLGLTLAQAGKRVCIVDTDLRRPVLSKLFGQPNETGITSIFHGVTDKKRLLIQTNFERLYLLPCGPIPPNPSELLTSPRMAEAVKNLRKDFDYILFDSPPILLVSDALIISGLTDGVLLVIRSGEATIQSSQMALDALVSIKANVIGTVLNRFDYKHSKYYHHYAKYYSRYRYGYYKYSDRKDGKGDTPAGAAPESEVAAG